VEKSTTAQATDAHGGLYASGRNQRARESPSRRRHVRVTVHVVTAHHLHDRWIDLQLRFLRRNLPGAVVWGSLQGISDKHHSKFDHVVPSEGPHAGKLNLMAQEVCAVAEEDDVLVFLDGDAMPIRPILPRIEEWLSRCELAAVQRLENDGDIQPHPCFAVTRVRTWQELHGDWSAGHPWRTESGEQVSDVGGNLLRELERRGTKWLPLLRSNSVQLHPLFFGIYADAIYHHGAGFRRGHGRVVKQRIDRMTRWIPSAAVRRALRNTWLGGVGRNAASISADLFEAATADDDFFRVLEGRS
jgi:hypothetical protein